MARAPFQKNVPKEDEFRINEQIRVPQVRLVGDNLEEISGIVGETIESNVYPTRKVFQWAQAAEMDVVEIAANANPPVVRIIDYSKFLYQKKRREKEIKSNTQKTVIKEIRFGPTTDDHDFEFKVRHARGFLQDGSKVKAYVQFKGRSILYQDKGELMLLNFIKELEDLGAPDMLPKMDGKRMMVMISPKKK